MRKLLGAFAAMAAVASISGFATFTTNFPPAGEGRVYEASLTQPSLRSCNLVGGGKVFCGPIEDPFFVDLGATYDVAGVLLTGGDDTHTVSADAVLVTVERGAATTRQRLSRSHTRPCRCDPDW